MDLQELRQRIDGIDDELVRLFEQRMDVSIEIAQYKKLHDIPIYDPMREKQKLYALSQKVDEGHKEHIAELYSLLFEISRAEQEKILAHSACCSSEVE